MLPFNRFAGADSLLGPEMRSTGEVMGIAADFPTAFGKAQAAAGVVLPREGSSSSRSPIPTRRRDRDRGAAHALGFELVATRGTAKAMEQMGLPVRRINKLDEGSPHVLDLIEARMHLVINTPSGSGARGDG